MVIEAHRSPIQRMQLIWSLDVKSNDYLAKKTKLYEGLVDNIGLPIAVETKSVHKLFTFTFLFTISVTICHVFLRKWRFCDEKKWTKREQKFTEVNKNVHFFK